MERDIYQEMLDARAKAAARKAEDEKHAKLAAEQRYQQELEEYRAAQRALFHGSDSAFGLIWPDLRKNWDLSRMERADPIEANKKRILERNQTW